MKKLKKILFTTLVILVLLIAGGIFFMGSVIQNTYNTLAPTLLGVNTHLGSVQAAPFRGKVIFRNLTIGNPEGFNTENMLSMGKLVFELDMASVFSDTIIVKELSISDVGVTYEKSLTTSNVDTFLKHLSSGESDKSKEKTEAPADDGKKKSVIIEKLSLTGGEIDFALTITGGNSLKIPLPPIHMTDLGKPGEPIKAIQAVREIIQTILKTVVTSVTQAGTLVTDGAKAIGQGALDAGQEALNIGKDVSGKAVDGVKGVGEAIGGLFSGKKE